MSKAKKPKPWTDEDRILAAARVLRSIRGELDEARGEYGENYDWSDLIRRTDAALEILSASDRILNDQPEAFSQWTSAGDPDQEPDDPEPLTVDPEEAPF